MRIIGVILLISMLFLSGCIQPEEQQPTTQPYVMPDEPSQMDTPDVPSKSYNGFTKDQVPVYPSDKEKNLEEFGTDAETTSKRIQQTLTSQCPEGSKSCEPHQYCVGKSVTDRSCCYTGCKSIAEKYNADCYAKCKQEGKSESACKSSCAVNYTEFLSLCPPSAEVCPAGTFCQGKGIADRGCCYTGCIDIPEDYDNVCYEDCMNTGNRSVSACLSQCSGLITEMKAPCPPSAEICGPGKYCTGKAVADSGCCYTGCIDIPENYDSVCYNKCMLEGKGTVSGCMSACSGFTTEVMSQCPVESQACGAGYYCLGKSTTDSGCCYTGCIPIEAKYVESCYVDCIGDSFDVKGTESSCISSCTGIEKNFRSVCPPSAEICAAGYYCKGRSMAAGDCCYTGCLPIEARYIETCYIKCMRDESATTGYCVAQCTQRQAGGIHAACPLSAEICPADTYCLGKSTTDRGCCYTGCIPIPQDYDVECYNTCMSGSAAKVSSCKSICKI